MNSMVGQALQYRRLRAPRENGATLIDPPAESVGELIARNAHIVAQSDYDVQGRSLADLAASARRQLVTEAFAYSRAYRSVDRLQPQGDRPILLAGHQPQLFHPGVWFKNFALGSLAAQHDAVPINLVIDSDTIKSATLRVPGGSVSNPTIEPIAYDRPSAEIPFEERPIVDRELLASFGRRAYEVIRPLVPQAMLPEFWPLVAERSQSVKNLGECLARARHQQEERWGWNTLELPQSRVVCQIDAFHWFTAHLLARLPRLWETYNSAVAEYRRVNHLRSIHHPVPSLAATDDWLEAPFWIWRADNPRRRQLFVRLRGDEIVLSDRQGLELPLPLTPEGDASAAVTRLHELQACGIRIRTRALITTLFARVFLGDVFLHGIGGAKYDQVTDLLMSRFFGLEPTGYMTVTATLRLPVPHAVAREDDLRFVAKAQREIAFHPERLLASKLAESNGAPHRSSDSSSGLEELFRTKRQWIDTPQTRLNAKQRCRAIRAANRQMQTWLKDDAQQLERERLSLVDRLRYEAVLGSREYAFCLFPADTLRQLFAQA